jgi:hypothetical protein
VSGPRNFDVVMAKLSRHPGKKRSLDMLLLESELPGHSWKRLDEKIWRTGVLSPRPEWSQRARSAGSFTCIRSFEQASPSRWMWTEVIPYVSSTDAESALADAFNNTLRNPRANVTVTSTQEIEGWSIEGTTSHRLLEMQTSGPHGDGATQTVAANVEGVLSVMAFAAQSGTWASFDIVTLVSAQAATIRSVATEVD